MQKYNIHFLIICKVQVLNDTDIHVVETPTLPALQWMAAVLRESLESQASRSSQNGLISSMGGGWWSSNGNSTTRLWNLSPSYFRSEHLQGKWYTIRGVDIRIKKSLLFTIFPDILAYYVCIKLLTTFITYNINFVCLHIWLFKSIRSILYSFLGSISVMTQGGRLQHLKLSKPYQLTPLLPSLPLLKSLLNYCLIIKIIMISQHNINLITSVNPSNIPP